MSSKTDELRAIFLRLSDTGEFVERQHEPRGDIRSDVQVDTELRAVVREMRDRFGFRTVLDDHDLVTVVRRYHADDTDRKIAAELGVSPETVTRARVNLHLFRESDTTAPFELKALERLVDAGASIAVAATELGVSESTARRYWQVVEALRTAARISHEYNTEFETILSESGVAFTPPLIVRNDRLIEADEFGSEVANS